MSRQILDADLDQLLDKLSLPEKGQLLAGVDFWRTTAIDHLGIPSVKVTDGPSGARGGGFLKMTPALCFPCGTALGATFNDKLIYQVGQVLGEETKARSAVCLLGPTLNICRSPLGGRAFESYSEDPILSGIITAAYVNGLQSKGVSATPKHFVANDQEHERDSVDSIVPMRALREVYLMAFQLALARSDPWAIMTSYGKLLGTHCSESKWLLDDVLRKEWGYKNLVMSDWYGTYSTAAAVNAGLSLEMPGPTRWRSPDLLFRSLSARKITHADVDKRAKEVLTFVHRAAKNLPDIVFGEDTEETLDNKEHQNVALAAAIGSIVLLKNDKQLLPIESGKVKSVALFGGSADMRHFSGGGSAEIGASYRSSPLEGIRRHLPKEIDCQYYRGCWAHFALPFLGSKIKPTSGKAETGCTLKFYAEDGAGKRVPEPVQTLDLPDSLARILDSVPKGLKRPWQAEISATFTADADGRYEFGLIVAGRARLYIDDKMVVEVWDDQTLGSAFFGAGTIEYRGSIQTQKGSEYDLRVEYFSEKPPGIHAPFDGGAVCFGAFPTLDPKVELQHAVEAAKKVDIPIVVVGLSAEFESEGFDRPNLNLPPGSDELVYAIADANPNTVVIVQSGSAVAMPWADKVSTILWAGYGGNEGGNALGHIVTGKASPSGRLSVTFPKRDEDVAAFLNYRSEVGRVEYTEGLYVGYKWHEARKITPNYAFGHGLSYTEFEYSDLVVNVDESVTPFKATATVNVKNVGKRPSSTSVLLYLSPPARSDPAGLSHPISSLRAFSFINDLSPGRSSKVEMSLDKYAICHWSQDSWTNEVGKWTARVGRSSLTSETLLTAQFDVSRATRWSGL